MVGPGTLRVSPEWDEPADAIGADIVEPGCQLDPVAFAFLSDLADQIAQKCASREFRHERLAENSQVSVFTSDGQLRKLADIESDIIRLALKIYDGNMSDIAHYLGVGRSTIYRKVEVLDH